MAELAKRRRSPGWIRDLPTAAVHGVLHHLATLRFQIDLSERQEYLWDACISELEYRRRRARSLEPECNCFYCMPPMFL